MNTLTHSINTVKEKYGSNIRSNIGKYAGASMLALSLSACGTSGGSKRLGEWPKTIGGNYEETGVPTTQAERDHFFCVPEYVTGNDCSLESIKAHRYNREIPNTREEAQKAPVDRHDSEIRTLIKGIEAEEDEESWLKRFFGGKEEEKGTTGINKLKAEQDKESRLDGLMDWLDELRN